MLFLRTICCRSRRMGQVQRSGQRTRRNQYGNLITLLVYCLFVYSFSYSRNGILDVRPLFPLPRCREPTCLKADCEQILGGASICRADAPTYDCIKDMRSVCFRVDLHRSEKLCSPCIKSKYIWQDHRRTYLVIPIRIAG